MISNNIFKKFYSHRVGHKCHSFFFSLNFFEFLFFMQCILIILFLYLCLEYLLWVQDWYSSSSKLWIFQPSTSKTFCYDSSSQYWGISSVVLTYMFKVYFMHYFIQGYLCY